MQLLEEMIPFVKEMRHQSAGRGLLKIYMLGSALVALGVSGWWQKRLRVLRNAHQTQVSGKASY
uniref:Uncharacterized protein n=1 Tax=Hippocampus comes TaxID=109280 RepID=A0A3Q2YRJ4_HIPCM